MPATKKSGRKQLKKQPKATEKEGLSLTAAARLAGVSRQALDKRSKRKPRDPFFFRRGGKIFVDDSSPSWGDYLESTSPRRALVKNTAGHPPPGEPSSLGAAKINADIRSKEAQAKLKELELEKKKKNLMPVEIVEKVTVILTNDLLRQISRIFSRHEDEFKSLLSTGEPGEANNLYLRALEEVVRENKKNKEDILKAEW